MDGGRRYIDKSEAIRHNELVEQARKAEHLRRCALSAAYKRVYDKSQEIKEYMGREQAKLADAINVACSEQRTSNIMGMQNSAVQPVQTTQPAPVPLPSDFHPDIFSNPLSALIIASMFMTKEQLEQMAEDNKAWEEMRQVNERYDNEMICMSGFEW